MATEAEKTAGLCLFEHTKCPSYGQNLFKSSADTNDPVSSWYDEIHDYTYSDNSCNPGKMCGHYTQVRYDASSSSSSSSSTKLIIIYF